MLRCMRRSTAPPSAALLFLATLLQASAGVCQHSPRPTPARRAEALAVHQFLAMSSQQVSVQASSTNEETSSNPAPLRIHTEYQLEGLDSQTKEMLQEALIPGAVEEIKRRLLVRSPTMGNLLIGRACENAIADVWEGYDEEQYSQDSYDYAGSYESIHEYQTPETCDPAARRRLCSDPTTGVWHNPEFLGPWEDLSSGQGVPDTDIIMYVSAKDVPDCQQGTAAYAGACEMDPVTSRPIAGYVNICPGALVWASQGAQFSQKEADVMLQVLVHEMLHVLFFSDNLYNLFVDAATGRRLSREEVLLEIEPDSSAASPRFLIILPEVVAAAQEHFGCPFVQGAELSNDEVPPASHWEKRVFMGELMDTSSSADTGQAAGQAVLSNLTLSLAEGSGWYLRNPATPATVLPFGHQAGCNLGRTPSCDPGESTQDSSPLYCPVMGAPGCTRDGIRMGRCVLDSAMDGCKIVAPLLPEHDCRRAALQGREGAGNLEEAVPPFRYHGPGGRCMMASAALSPLEEPADDFPSCFRMFCVLGHHLFVQAGSTSYSCPEGETIEVSGAAGDQGTATYRLGPCPDNMAVCLGLDEAACPGDCHTHGNCIPSGCQCFLGWEGDGCERRTVPMRRFPQSSLASAASEATAATSPLLGAMLFAAGIAAAG
mmetsp:Transcript_21242/g.59060  ORF Transcript_21242/g.59060 Transcript_21242/m.59060 type:complete len:657 (-) Transcript_21242:36-2006(-)